MSTHIHVSKEISLSLFFSASLSLSFEDKRPLHASINTSKHYMRLPDDDVWGRFYLSRKKKEAKASAVYANAARSHRAYMYPRKWRPRVIMRGYRVICHSRGYALTGSFIYLIAGFNWEKCAANDTSAGARVNCMRATCVFPSHAYTCVLSRGED